MAAVVVCAPPQVVGLLADTKELVGVACVLLCVAAYDLTIGQTTCCERSKQLFKRAQRDLPDRNNLVEYLGRTVVSTNMPASSLFVLRLHCAEYSPVQQIFSLAQIGV